MQVVRAAEEAASTLAGSIHPEQCIKVLCPIVQTADYPINLAAIKMQTKVVERIAKESLHQLLPDIIPGLLQVSILYLVTSVTLELVTFPSLWNTLLFPIQSLELFSLLILSWYDQREVFEYQYAPSRILHNDLGDITHISDTVYQLQYAEWRVRFKIG